MIAPARVLGRRAMTCGMCVWPWPRSMTVNPVQICGHCLVLCKVPAIPRALPSSSEDNFERELCVCLERENMEAAHNGRHSRCCSIESTRCEVDFALQRSGWCALCLIRATSSCRQLSVTGCSEVRPSDPSDHSEKSPPPRPANRR
jgi:hypothetical protein